MSITMEKVTGSWATWAEKFLAAPVCEMSVHDSALFASCCLNEKAEDFPGQKITSSFPYKLIAKRAHVLGLGLDEGVSTFLALSTGSPGTLVMYLCAIKYAMRKRSDNHSEPDFDTVSLQQLAEMFPVGFVNTHELERLWDAQKGNAFDLKCDNLLDYLTQSLAFIPAEPAQEEPSEPGAEAEEEQGE